MIPVSILNFHIVADEPIHFGQNPGSKLRGALYEALGLIYDNGQEVHSRHAYHENPVAWLLRLEDNATSGGKQVLRPMAIRPPLVPLAQQTSFGIAFFGSGHQCIPMVISAVQAMQTIGLGPTRQPFQLERIDYVNPLTNRVLILVDSKGKQLNALPDPLTETDYVAHAEAIGPKLTLRFLTPTQIVTKGRLSSKLTFCSLFQRLMERIQLISENYTSHQIEVDFDDMLSRAKQVKLIRHSVQWNTTNSYSSSSMRELTIAGFTGSATYEPIHTTLIPWLLLGQATQIGQNTIKGCGWYRVEANISFETPSCF